MASEDFSKRDTARQNASVDTATRSMHSRRMRKRYHDRLRDTTERRRIPATAVAAIAGVTEQCARAWMRGDYMPGPVPAEALRVALGVRPPSATERATADAMRGAPAEPSGAYAVRLALALLAGRMTRIELGRALGVDRRMVGSWAAGDSLPSDSHAVAVCAVLGVEVPSEAERAEHGR